MTEKNTATCTEVFLESLDGKQPNDFTEEELGRLRQATVDHDRPYSVLECESLECGARFTVGYLAGRFAIMGFDLEGRKPCSKYEAPRRFPRHLLPGDSR